MATYLQNVTDQFPQEQQFSPDYSFLANALGTTQQRFNRGLDKVHSLYSSLLNSNVSNSENEQYRQDAFKKISGDIKSLTTTDLSKVDNVNKAMSIFNPIVNDKELAYDMYFTNKTRSAIGEYNALSSDKDAKNRMLANPLALEYIEQGADQMRQAHRGDNSIFKVAPREFVRFEDVTGYLDDEAKKSGLEMQFSDLNGMYIVETTGGVKAISQYKDWVNQTLGNKFDKQFMVEASVRAERQVRNAMNSLGVSKEQAYSIVGEAVKQTSLKNYQVQEQQIDNFISHLDKNATALKEANPRGLNPQKQAQYDEYVNRKDAYLKLKNDLQVKIASDYQQPSSFFGKNLQEYIFDEAKDNFISEWGTNKAMTQFQQKIRPDEVKMQERAHRYSIEEKRLQQQMNIQLEGYRSQLRMKETDYRLRLEDELKNSKQIQYNGIYTSAEQSITGLDNVQTVRSTNTHQIVEAAFGNPNGNNAGGLVYATVGNAERFNTLINKLQSQASGGKVSFSEKDSNLLKEFSKILGTNTVIPANANQANNILYKFSNKILNRYSGATKDLGTEETKNLSSRYSGRAAQLRQLLEEEDQAYNAEQNAYRNAIRTLPDLRDKFDVVGRDQKGRPVYRIKDNAKLKDEEKVIISKQLPLVYNNQTEMAGSSYTMNKVDGNMYTRILNSANNVIVDGKKNAKINNASLAPDERAKQSGNQMTIDLDPGKKIAHVTFRPVKIDDKHDGQVIEAEVPYDKLRDVDPRLAQRIDANTYTPVGLSILTPLLSDPHAEVEMPTELRNAGFDAEVSLGTGLNASTLYLTGSYLDDKGHKHPLNTRLDVSYDGSGFQPAQLRAIEKSIYETYERYVQTYKTN